jgi:hypothetical protein
MRRAGAGRGALLAALLLVTSTSGFRCPDGSIIYLLDEPSAWLEGCIRGPCLCPAIEIDDLAGVLKIIELPTLQPGPWRLFQVQAVQWDLRRGDRRVRIHGTGFYRTAAPVLDEHRLVLDLAIDGAPIQLDSGVVAGALAFPPIEIEVLTLELCVQQGVQMSASPAPGP